MTGNLVGQIVDAEARIRPHVRETPLVHSPALSAATGAEVWLKCENLQVTGSFKVRGAMNRLMTLSADERQRGVTAASSGNHGIAVAHAGRALGIPVTVYVPEGASPAKVAAMQRLGADVMTFGTDGLDSEVEARRSAESEGRFYASPYNDLVVVAGQGTLAIELRRQLDDISAVVVAVGGGGLIGGIAVDLKHHNASTRIVGAQPANSKVMIESIRAGHVVEIPSLPTLSDGSAGGIEAGAVTFPLNRDLVSNPVSVKDGYARVPEGPGLGVELDQAIVEQFALV